ncbi:MAG TPA: hypothetical protein VIU63_04260, partial [Nitrospira sp.]
KKRRRVPSQSGPDAARVATDTKPRSPGQFGEETEEDRVKALADAESKNLWDATEVIDMDRF